MTLATRLGTALLTTLLVVGVGLLGSPPARAAEAIQAGTGSTHLADQVLRSGCHSYRYTYALSSPTGDWIFETFLLDPRRQRVASDVYTSDSDPNPGSGVFSVCRSSTRYGRFKVRGKLTTYDGDDQASAWVTPSYVRLHRPGR